MAKRIMYRLTLLLFIVLTGSGCGSGNDGNSDNSDADDTKVNDSNGGTWDNMNWNDDSWS